MNLPHRVIHYVIGTITSCWKKIMELEKENKNRSQIWMGNNLCYPIISIVRGKLFSTYNTNVQNNGIYLYNR